MSASSVTSPSCAAGWEEILERPDHGDHIALVYQDDDSLLESVRRFVDAGLRAGDGVVLLCTLTRWQSIRQRLAGSGVDAASAIKRGQLARYGVHGVLLKWMAGDCSPAAFLRAAAATVEIERGRYPAVRVFSEMAEVLWQRDRLGAMKVEQAWNRFIRYERLSVLSAWRLDSLDEATYAGGLQSVCLMHGRIVPDDHHRALDDAVVIAALEIMGHAQARMAISIAAAHPRSRDVPFGQALLLWLKENMPRAAERVLARVRETMAKPQASA